MLLEASANVHMKFLLLLVGLLLLVLGAVGFFVLLMRGTESILVYPTAACMYVGLGVTLFATLVLWSPVRGGYGASRLQLLQE